MVGSPCDQAVEGFQAREAVASKCLICNEKLADESNTISEDEPVVDKPGEATESCTYCHKLTHVYCLSLWFDKGNMVEKCPYCRVDVTEVFVERVIRLGRGDEVAEAWKKDKDTEITWSHYNQGCVGRSWDEDEGDFSSVSDHHSETDLEMDEVPEGFDYGPEPEQEADSELDEDEVPEGFDYGLEPEQEGGFELESENESEVEVNTEVMEASRQSPGDETAD